MRWRYAVGAAAVILFGAGGARAASRLAPEPSLDADARAVVEQVETGSHDDADTARFVEDNVAVLLSEDVAEEADGSDLASVFDVALRGDAADGVFETVVAAVSEEGALHSPDLRPVFGAAAAARMAWFDTRINAFRSDNADHWGELRGRYDAAHDFLREAMRDPE